MHKSETSLVSNTATLAEQTIDTVKIFIRGKKDHDFSAEQVLLEGHENLYLYPDEDAQVLNQEYLDKLEKPVNLIVPDGSWRQARKYLKREMTFSSLKRVKLSDIGESIYQLRKSPGTDSLCTFEAIAYALRSIDGERVFNTLMNNLRFMVRAHLTTRISDKRLLEEKLNKVGIDAI
jgi:DTW domain-containing protein YfiP